MLERTIEKQEARLEDIEEKQIPLLLKEAKLNLQQGNRKAALQCLARKKKLDAMQDVIKAAIFHMETQVFMLENALEDRQIQDALKSASEAMQGIQATVGVDAAELQNILEGSINPVAQASAVEIDFDEEELALELEQWATPQKKPASETPLDDDEISILSLPKVSPAKPLLTKNSSSSKEKPRRNLLRAVLG